jgi:hypothetical protein
LRQFLRLEPGDAGEPLAQALEPDDLRFEVALRWPSTLTWTRFASSRWSASTIACSHGWFAAAAHLSVT